MSQIQDDIKKFHSHINKYILVYPENVILQEIL